MKQRERSAYHEAGHAVVAHVLGLRVERVSLVENEQSGGRTVVPWPEGFEPYGDEDYALMEKHLAAIYGGTKAVEILTGRPLDPNDPNLDFCDVGTDYDLANDLILRLAAEENKQLEVSGRALEQAERILRDNWSNVRKVADWLLSQNELNGNQIAAILATEGEEQ